MKQLRIELIDPFERIERVEELLKQLNPDKRGSDMRALLEQMVAFPNYQCFGLFDDQDLLIGISSAWTTVRIYSNKQLELDNVIIDKKKQSMGYGKVFFDLMEDWAKKHDYKSVELNTYVQNSRSHKFYFNTGYRIGGYHFQKDLAI